MESMMNDLDLDGLTDDDTPTDAVDPGLAGDSDGTTGGSGTREARPAPLIPNSAVAQALWRVWSGERVTVVDSPPGGGKSELLATVVAHLVNRAGLRVTVATPTRAQAISISWRIATQLPSDSIEVAIKDVSASDLPPGIFGGKRNFLGTGKGMVSIRTIASLKRSSKVDAEVVIIDEAYQANFADVAAAANSAAQVLLVGDPGQIGRVITVDMSAWEHPTAAPHRRSPEVFAAREDAATIHIDKSYRLGQATVDAIAPLYDFPFTSTRPDRTLRREDGSIAAEIEPVVVPATGDHDSLRTLEVVAARAADLVGRVRHEVMPGVNGADGSVVETVLEPRDIAVVVSRNSQASVVTGLLAARDLDGIAVGTADRLQGGQ
jgi:hypothetical protein